MFALGNLCKNKNTSTFFKPKGKEENEQSLGIRLDRKMK